MECPAILRSVSFPMIAAVARWLAVAQVLLAPIVASGNEETPLRVFSKSNISEAGTPPQPNLGYGTAYLTGYGALWSGK